MGKTYKEISVPPENMSRLSGPCQILEFQEMFSDKLSFQAVMGLGNVVHCRLAPLGVLHLSYTHLTLQKTKKRLDSLWI